MFAIEIFPAIKTSMDGHVADVVHVTDVADILCLDLATFEASLDTIDTI